MAKYRVYNGANEWNTDYIDGPGKPLFGDGFGTCQIVSRDMIYFPFHGDPFSWFSCAMMDVACWEYQIITADGRRFFTRQREECLEIGYGDGWDVRDVHMTCCMHDLNDFVETLLTNQSSVLIIRMMHNY